MSMPSITIRLDFGDASSAGVSSGISLQGAAPTPMGFGAGVASISSQGGMSDSGAPTPFANAAAAALHDPAPTPFANAAAAAVQDAAPTPMSGIGAAISTALASTPPEPSPEMASAAQASGAPPRPEGEPRGESKNPANKR